MRAAHFARFGGRDGGKLKHERSRRDSGGGVKVVNDTTRERTRTMHQEINPIPVRRWTLNGLTERLIVAPMQGHGGSRCG
jgi:hypothetical protein